MTQEEFNENLWRKKWSSDVLTSPDLKSRRQKANNVRLISLDRERAVGVFVSERDTSQTYTATLTDCTCMDFAIGHGERPCKHIFRVAQELGLLAAGTLSPNVLREREVLPESLRFADERLVEKYVNILRFIYRGREIRIKQFKRDLSDLEAKITKDEKEAQTISKKKSDIRKSLDTWTNFRDEALKIKNFKYNDEPDEFLDRLVDRNLVEGQENPVYTNLTIPRHTTLNSIEKILSVYGQHLPLFSETVTENPAKVLSRIMQTQRRSEQILRAHDADDTPDWAFFVPACFNDALDIQLVYRTKNLVEYAVWTQGINFAFNRGDMFYKNRELYEKGEPAIQIVSAEGAGGSKAESLEEYYLGRVFYRDFEKGETKTKTQMDFVKMLIWG